MATIRQKKIAKALIEAATMDNPPTKGEIVESNGYGPSMSKNPKVVLESKGVKDALAEYGLTEELITTALVADIYNKENNRLGELKLGADILGMTKKDDGGGNKTLVVVLSNESGQRYAAQ